MGRLENIAQNIVLHHSRMSVGYDDLYDTVNAHFEQLQKIKPYTDGTQLCTTKRRISTVGDTTLITAQEIDFKLLLYLESNPHLRSRFNQKGLFIKGLIETTDEKYVLGVAGPTVHYAHSLQLIGGGIDTRDVVQSSNPLHALYREMEEEIGVSHQSVIGTQSLGLYSNALHFGLMYAITIEHTSSEIKTIFDEHIKTEMQPEICSLVCLSKHNLSLESFPNKRPYVAPVIFRAQNQ